jgi:hypothetical protein
MRRAVRGDVSHRTALPLVLSLTAFGAAACDGDVSQSSVSTTGSGGSGGDPTTTTTTSTTSTSAGGAPPDCREESVLSACASGPNPTPDPFPVPFEATGVVTSIVHTDLESSLCWFDADQGAVTLGLAGSDPVVEVEIDDPMLGAIRVAFDLPGFTASSLVPGDVVGVTAAYVPDSGELGGPLAHGHIVVTKNGALVAGVADTSALPGVDTSRGAEVCYEQGDFCDKATFELEVTVGQDSATIASDTSVAVGGLLVTSDELFEYYDTGNCNFAQGVSLFGAAAVDP